jgi:hypothetical protein
MADYDDDHPEVIKAKAEAKARVMEARAKLHPAAQAIYALWDSFSDLIGQIGCLLIILIIVLAIFAPQIINSLFK